MCVKLYPKNLNLDLYFPHPTSTYTCGVTIAPKCAVMAIVLTCSKWWERQRHSLQHSNSKKKRFTAFPELHMLIFFIKLHLYSLFFANLFYYSTYFYYYSWALLHLLVLFIGPAILFQPSFTFIYNIFSKKISVSHK